MIIMSNKQILKRNIICLSNNKKNFTSLPKDRFCKDNFCHQILVVLNKNPKVFATNIGYQRIAKRLYSPIDTNETPQTDYLEKNKFNNLPRLGDKTNDFKDFLSEILWFLAQAFVLGIIVVLGMISMYLGIASVILSIGAIYDIFSTKNR